MPNPYEAELAAILNKSKVSQTGNEIDFKTKAQEACYRQVREYGRELFGEMMQPSRDVTRPTFFLRFGSASIAVTVNPWGDEDAMIDVWCWVITDVEMTDDLVDYLLRENYGRRFGAFRIDDKEDIHYSHRIVGSSLDKNELRTSVMNVASNADEYDEIIKNRWGGKRWIDPDSD